MQFFFMVSRSFIGPPYDGITKHSAACKNMPRCVTVFACAVIGILSRISVCEKVREWFAEVQRRLDSGLDPFVEPAAAGRTGEGKAAQEDEEETRGQRSESTEEQAGPGVGDEEDDEDEDDGDETDDSEVWEPSRSVRKSLSLSED